MLAELDSACLVNGAWNSKPSFDLQCPSMSLPLALKATLDTIPACSRYLRADRSRVDRWRSPLSYLRRLPLACLKVDQSFTPELTVDSHSRSLKQAIIRVAEALEMTASTEGVETRGQLRWTRDRSCGVGQGYLFGHPIPAALVHATAERIEVKRRTLN